MSFTVIGLSHHQAPIDVRQRFHRNAQQCAELLKKWHHRAPQHSFLLLSTCNRLELYTDLALSDPAFETCARELCFSNDLFYQHSYTLQGQECVLHLFKVACGLDSKIIGENQIISQLKQAFHLSKSHHCLKHAAQRLFEKSFYWAKQFKNQENFSCFSNRSWGAIAAQFINTMEGGSSPERSLLIIGAGQTIEQCLAHYQKRPLDRLTLCNRHKEKLVKLRYAADSNLISLSQLPASLQERHFDIIVVATASQTPLIWAKDLATSNRAVVLIDLSVPRNTEAAIEQLPDKKVYLLDDLPLAAEMSLPQHWEYLEEAAKNFISWLESDKKREIIKKQREKMAHAQKQLLEKALKKLNHGQLPQEVLKIFGHQLLQKLLHQYPVEEKQDMIE